MASAGKSQLGALVLLLALLGGYGTWNYQKHVEAEAKQIRPFRGYSEEQLEQLLAAYDQEAKTLGARYAKASKQRARSGNGQALSEAVDQFAAVQRAGRRTRALGAKLSEEEASIAAIRQEQSYRASAGSGVLAFLQRAFVPPPS